MNMKRIAAFTVFLFLNLTAWAETYTLYVSDQTGWSVFDLYAWGDSEAFGAWPGATSAPVVTRGGIRFKTYTYTANGSSMQLHLIFHNNVGEDLPGDERQLFTLTEPGDCYLKVTSTSVSRITPPDDQQDPGETQSGEWTIDNSTAISDDNRVIYELNLYDFTSAGTLAAAQARLTQLRKLGIDIIWLMPVFPRSVQGKIGTLGSPYAPKDYTSVNPAHGSVADLQAFVNAAHDLGMSVWLDWVPNHTGLDHTWVSAHPDYYVWENGSIKHPNDYGDVYQLNYSSTAMKNAMIDAMRYWVNTADIDGFRCDYASSPAIGSGFWTQATAALQNNDRNKRVEMLAEADFTDWNASSLLNAGFDYDYAWGYADALKSVGNGTSATNARNAAQNLLTQINSSYNHMSRMTYITNHDDIGDNFSHNYLSVLGSNVAPMTVMYFTFFGMPLLYNGQEIGQTAILNYFERNTINWNAVNTRIHNTIRTLVALKHTQPALADGPAGRRASTRLINTGNSSVIAYEKTKGDNVVLVVISLSDQPVSVTLPNVTAGAYTRVLDSQTITSGFAATPVTLTASPTISLPAKGYHVYTNAAVSDTPAQINPTYHIYVSDRTGWSTLDLYEWGEPNEIFGGWPGAVSAPNATLHGITWRDYTYTLSETTTAVQLHLIFHNNVGEDLPGDQRQLITITEPRDYYLIVTSSGITEYSPTSVNNQPACTTPRKYICRGQLYIQSNGHTYTAQGFLY